MAAEVFADLSAFRHLHEIEAVEETSTGLKLICKLPNFDYSFLRYESICAVQINSYGNISERIDGRPLT